MHYIIAILYIVIFIMLFIDANHHGASDTSHQLVKYFFPACVLLFVFNRFTYIPKLSDILLLHIIIEIFNLILLALVLFFGDPKKDRLQKERWIFYLLVILSAYHMIRIVFF